MWWKLNALLYSFQIRISGVIIMQQGEQLQTVHSATAPVAVTGNGAAAVLTTTL